MSTYDFPANPGDGDIFELRTGVLYQYSSAFKSWTKIASNSIIHPKASNTQNGLMTSEDLRKLNRLVLPPPSSTIIGNDCLGSYESGVVGMYSGDDYVNVEGSVSIGNIDELGTRISTTEPFHILQHTYGYDFNLDLPALVTELEDRGQLHYVGETGEKGKTGDRGEPGVDYILSGDKGLRGVQGTAPESGLALQEEPILAELKPNMDKAFVSVEVIPNPDNPYDPDEFYLQFRRQSVGKAISVNKFVVESESNSSWILAVQSVINSPQYVFYVDVQPIIDTIRDRFLIEVERLKKGYEDIVNFWLHTMSKLFDEQKVALSCALEFCISKTKSAHIREHIENVAAAAYPDGKVKIKSRAYGTEMSNTKLLSRLPDAKDVCGVGPLAAENAAEVQGAEDQSFKSQDAEGNVSVQVVIDPTINIMSPNNGQMVELEAGTYIATILNTTSSIGNKFHARIRLKYVSNGTEIYSDFVDKGEFESLMQSQYEYSGLTLPFKHDGGMVSLYYPVLPHKEASGSTTINISKNANVVIPRSGLKFTPAQATKYSKLWAEGQLLGFVAEVSDQKYIVAWISEFESAVAWPTADGKSYIKAPRDVTLKYDANLNAEIDDDVKPDINKFSRILFPIL